MSLIVAYCHENKVLLLSDTKMTDDFTINKFTNKEKTLPYLNSWEKGQIKFQFISKNVVVAYAGEEKFAKKLYIKLHSEKYKIEQIKHIILKTHFDSKNKTDFIFLNIKNGKSSLSKFSDYKLRNDIESAYIGHEDAIVNFKSEVSKNLDRFTWESVFKKIINMGKHSSVGEILITLINDENYYIDMNSYIVPGGIELSSTTKTQLITPAGVPVDFDLDKGGFSFSRYESNINYLAFYLFAGRRGLIFKLKDGMMNGEYINNISQNSFNKKVKDDTKGKVYVCVENKLNIREILDDLVSLFNKWKNQKLLSQLNYFKNELIYFENEFKTYVLKAYDIENFDYFEVLEFLIDKKLEIDEFLLFYLVVINAKFEITIAPTPLDALSLLYELRKIANIIDNKMLIKFKSLIIRFFEYFPNNNLNISKKINLIIMFYEIKIKNMLNYFPR